MTNLWFHNDLVAEAAFDLGDGLICRLNDDAAGIACPLDMNARHLTDSLFSASNVLEAARSRSLTQASSALRVSGSDGLSRL